MFIDARLPSGLVLEYLDLGDPDGTPVVYQPGSPSTAGCGVLLDDAARRAGVRLVSLSRPGYGASTVTPPSLASVGQQVVELADLLGWSRFATFGSSGGGPYAVATAAVAPDRVSLVAVAAGPAPSEEEPSADELAAEVRDFAERLLPLEPAEFQAAMAETTPPNEHHFDDRPAEAATFFADLRRALDPPDGFARDNLSWGGPWDVDLAAVSTPVQLLYGDADLMVPLANGHRLAELLPHATLTVLPGAGHGDTTFASADRVLALFSTGG